MTMRKKVGHKTRPRQGTQLLNWGSLLYPHTSELNYNYICASSRYSNL